MCGVWGNPPIPVTSLLGRKTESTSNVLKRLVRRPTFSRFHLSNSLRDRFAVLLGAECPERLPVSRLVDNDVSAVCRRVDDFKCVAPGGIQSSDEFF